MNQKSLRITHLDDTEVSYLSDPALKPQYLPSIKVVRTDGAIHQRDSATAGHDAVVNDVY